MDVGTKDPVDLDSVVRGLYRSFLDLCILRREIVDALSSELKLLI